MTSLRHAICLAAITTGLLCHAAGTCAAQATAESATHPPLARILNGQSTFEFPAVGEMSSDGGFCTATLIGCETVLTAAHCLCAEGADTYADCLRAGTPEPDQIAFFFQHVGLMVARSISIHPQFNFGTSGDVAVIKLATPVSGITPAVINTSGKPAVGTAGTVVGFGRIQGGEFPLGVGIKRIASVETEGCAAADVPDGAHLCSQASASVHGGVCPGDSGGPLFVGSDAGLVVAGVASGANPFIIGEACAPGDVDFYTDVQRYREFVENEAGDDLGAAACGDLPPVGSADTTVQTFDGELTDTTPELRAVVQVPPKTILLRVTMNGVLATEAGRNNFDLYVQASTAAAADYACIDSRPSAIGTCDIPAPSPGPWHVLAQQVTGTGEVQITATLFGGGVPSECVGDCNGSRTVTIDELIHGVAIALGSAAVTDCPAFDPDGAGTVSIAVLVRAVNAALNGCAS